MDEPSEGTLRFSGHWILTNVFVLKPTFSLPLRPHRFTQMLQPRAERSPTDADINIL